MDNPDDKLREIHSRELPNRNLHPDQFGSAGPLGAVFNRTGGLGSTEMSQQAHHIQGAGRGASKLVQDGDV